VEKTNRRGSAALGKTKRTAGRPVAAAVAEGCA
jgi:hypothetical protein